MSLFSSFKKALGFPDEYEDLDDLSDLEDADLQDSAEVDSPAEAESADPEEAEAEAAIPVKVPQKTPEAVTRMEKRIAQLEAELEQQQLANKCMADKLRGHSPEGESRTAAQDSKSREEINRLNSELRHVKTRLAQAQTEIDRLKSEAAKAEDHTAETEELNRTLAGLRSLNAQMTDRLKQAELNEGSARAEADRATDAAEKLRQEIKATREAHNRTVEELRAEIRRLNSLLQASDASTGILPEMGVAQPENPKEKRGKNKRKRKPGQPVGRDNAAPKPKISAIDELMDNTDWFIAAEPGPRPKDPDTEENFGYREPARKPAKNNNDKNQLTLF